MIDKLFKTPIGIIIISIIWGLGLSTLFKYSCSGKKCKVILYKGPNVNEMENTIFNYGTDKCYRYSPVMTTCPL